jgi:hypothetical protein
VQNDICQRIYLVAASKPHDKSLHHRDTEKTFFINRVLLSEEETEERSFLAVEGPLLTADVMDVGVLRLRERFAARNAHCAQDDRKFDLLGLRNKEKLCSS